MEVVGFGAEFCRAEERPRHVTPLKLLCRLGTVYIPLKAFRHFTNLLPFQ